MVKIDELLEEISTEKQLISDTFTAMQKTLNRSNREDTELASIAMCLHSIYNGIENIFRRILKFKEISLPSSDSSHRDLLNLVVTNGIISSFLSEQLDEYRRFRHFIRHAYVVKLKENEIMKLVENLPDIYKNFESELDTFIESLKQQEQKNDSKINLP